MADLNSLLSAAQTAEATAGNMATQAPLLQDQFTNALKQKFATDNPLMQQRDTYQKNFLAAGQNYSSENAQKYGGAKDTIFSPSTVRNLMTQERAAALTPLLGIQSNISMGYGGLHNIIDSASKAYSAQVGAAQNAAQLARQSYADAYQKYQDDRNYALQQQSLAAQLNSLRGNNTNPPAPDKGRQIILALDKASADRYIDDNEIAIAGAQLVSQAGYTREEAYNAIMNVLNNKVGNKEYWKPPTKKATPPNLYQQMQVLTSSPNYSGLNTPSSMGMGSIKLK